MVHESHNHPITENLGVYSVARQFNLLEKSSIRRLAQAGVAPTAILSYLKRQLNNVWSTRKDVNNEISRARVEYLSGRSPILALFDMVCSDSYFHDFLLHPSGRVQSLFFVNNSVLQLNKMFSTVFLMDCTYKTNRFGLPLLNLIGVTSTYRSFNAGFAFLKGEEESDYKWALEAFKRTVSPQVILTDNEVALMNALGVVFPNASNFICVWHINKRVLTQSKIKGTWSTEEEFQDYLKDWEGVVYSKTEPEYDLNLETFSNKWRVSQPIAVKYLEDQLMNGFH